jgi:hypothetical protein
MMLGAQKVSVLVLVCIARTGGPSSGGIDAGKASGSRTNGAPSGGHALTTGQHGGGRHGNTFADRLRCPVLPCS